MMKNNFFIISAISFLWILLANNMYAHGFGERYDLPIPLTFFLIGAGLTIIFSFFLLLLFYKQNKKTNEFKSPVIINQNTLNNISFKLIKYFIKISSVFIFLLIILTGYLGSNNPIENFSAPMIWIIWWVGFGIITPIIGDFWKILNPIKIIFSFIVEKIIKQPKFLNKGLLKYPKALDVWPIIFSFLLFSWFENVGNGSSPLTLSILITFYSVLTITFMFLFGCKTWLEKGDVFSVYYHIMGSFGIFNILQNQNLKTTQISLRLPVLGLAKLKTPTMPFVIFHIILLGTISFDGLSETSLWSKTEILLIPAFGRMITESFGIIIIPTLFFILLWIICWIISIITKEKTPETIITSLIFSLTPIAIAYHIAHYLSYILITGQLIIPLISDPFGLGWNIFGTSNYSLNIGIINAKTAWYSSVMIIVLGHIFSVIISHIKAKEIFSENSIVIRSQIPFLILMIFYTALSLWIISQPIINQ